MISRIRWWLVGLRNPFIRAMNIAEHFSIKEMREFAEWLKAEADCRDADTGKK